jgi:hypothetical protein
VLFALGQTAVLGRSDLLCAQVGLRSPAGAPPGFTLRLNESANADLTWKAPGGQLGYLLLAAPLDGRPPRVTVLPSGATSASDATGGSFTCYQLYAVFPVGLSRTDLACGLPGVAQLPPEAARATGTPQVAEAAARTSAGPVLSRSAGAKKRLDRPLREGQRQVEARAARLRREVRAAGR